MLPLITQLLSYGYGASQILTFVGSKFKNMSKGIQEAKTQGYDDDSILKFLSGKIPAKKKDVERQTTANDRYMSGIGFKSKEEKEETTNKFIRGAFDIGSSALGAYALYRSLPKVAGGIASAAKNLGQASNAKNPITPSNNPPNPPNPPPPPPPLTAAAPQIQQATQASVNPITQQSLQTTSNVSPPTSQKHRPSTIEEIKRLHEVYKKHKEQKPDSKFTFAQILKTNLGISDEDAARFAKIYEETSENKPKDILDRGLPESLENLKQKVKQESNQVVEKIKKLAVFPDGQIGNIESIKNGIAKVNVDGIIRNRKMDDLIESPMPEKDLADLYDELTAETEKQSGQELSRNVRWSGYDPKTNELAYKPYGGALYVYEDISPEDAKQLTSVLNRRKTSGENFIGEWVEGTKSPIGNAMSTLIKRLQAERGGKGNEYRGKYETLYDAYERGETASKEKLKAKNKRLRDEEKAKKKKAKKPRPS